MYIYLVTYDKAIIIPIYLGVTNSWRNQKNFFVIFLESDILPKVGPWVALFHVQVLSTGCCHVML